MGARRASLPCAAHALLVRHKSAGYPKDPCALRMLFTAVVPSLAAVPSQSLFLIQGFRHRDTAKVGTMSHLECLSLLDNSLQAHT